MSFSNFRFRLRFKIRLWGKWKCIFFL